MLRERETDRRRRGYSLRKHIQRAVRTKGLGRALLPVVTVVAVAGVLLASCEGGSRITEPQVKATGPAVPRSANGDLLLPPGNSSGNEPLVWADQACDGEWVAGTGKQAYDLWLDGNEGVHMRIARHYTFDGTGYLTQEAALNGDESLATGNTFHGAGDFMDESYVQSDGFPFEDTYVDIVTLKSQTAPNANYRKKILFHLTWTSLTDVPNVKFSEAGTDCDNQVVP